MCVTNDGGVRVPSARSVGSANIVALVVVAVILERLACNLENTVTVVFQIKGQFFGYNVMSGGASR